MNTQYATQTLRTRCATANDPVKAHTHFCLHGRSHAQATPARRALPGRAAAFGHRPRRVGPRRPRAAAHVHAQRTLEHRRNGHAQAVIPLPDWHTLAADGVSQQHPTGLVLSHGHVETGRGVVRVHYGLHALPQPLPRWRRRRRRRRRRCHRRYPMRLLADTVVRPRTTNRRTWRWPSGCRPTCRPGVR